MKPTTTSCQQDQRLFELPTQMNRPTCPTIPLPRRARPPTEAAAATSTQVNQAAQRSVRGLEWTLSDLSLEISEKRVPTDLSVCWPGAIVDFKADYSIG